MKFEIQPRDIIPGKLLPSESYDEIKRTVPEFCKRANEIIAAWLEHAVVVYGEGQFWGPKHPAGDDLFRARVVCIEPANLIPGCAHTNFTTYDMNHARCIDCGKNLTATWSEVP